MNGIVWNLFNGRVQVKAVLFTNGLYLFENP